MLHELIQFQIQMFFPILFLECAGIAICCFLILDRMPSKENLRPASPIEEIENFLESDSYKPRSKFGIILQREYEAVCGLSESDRFNLSKKRSI